MPKLQVLRTKQDQTDSRKKQRDEKNRMMDEFGYYDDEEVELALSKLYESSYSGFIVKEVCCKDVYILLPKELTEPGILELSMFMNKLNEKEENNFEMKWVMKHCGCT